LDKKSQDTAVVNGQKDETRPERIKELKDGEFLIFSENCSILSNSSPLNISSELG